MLHALDETLKKLLQEQFPRDVLRDMNLKPSNLKISFETPYKGGIEKPAINLFLYDVRENLELRNTNSIVERNHNGKALKKRPPARVDCSYLITAWSANDNSSTEHQLLGGVMKLLLRHPRIPTAFLVDELQGQEPPLRLVSLRPSNLQSFGEFWQAMGGKDGTKPKVVLHCTVTISVPVDETGEEVGLVGVYQPSLRSGS